MKTFRLALLLATASLPAVAHAQAPAPAPSDIRVPPIAYTQRTLANGLKVYAVRDPSTATVSVQVWYNVGSKDDPRGRSGFAHMFEHLMFKATRNLVPEQIDRLTEDVGGYNNASTADDYTNYYEVVPANHLQRLLFAEADRMATLVVDPATFASERDVVKEELRSRVLAQPYGKLFYQYLPTVTYQRHPYARPGIGSIADLDAATIEDIRAFHATYYRPDNAVLVVAGNFDPAQLDRWVDRYFAPIARPDRPIPRVTVDEPVRTKQVSYTVHEANTPLPAVLLAYALPPAKSADTPALTVLDAILSGGESSRLYQALVYRDQLAQSAGSFFEEKQGPGSFAVYAILAGGKTAEAGEAALRRELAALAAAPVSTAELAEAKNQLLTAALLGRETAEGKASALADAVVTYGDPKAAERALADIAAVTAADVQRVARTYLAPERSAAIRYLPAEEGAPAGTPIAVADTVVTAPLVAPPGIVVHTPAPAGARVLPPEPGAPVSPTLPTPVETRLANGMRVVVVPRPELPIVTATLVAAGGAAADPSGRAGLADVTAELMTKGTATRSATEIAQAIEALGGSIGSDAGWDGAQVSLTVKSDAAPQALAILADVARNPAFAAEELDRTRAQAIDAVKVQLTSPGALAGLVANRAIYGAQAYGHPLGGTPASLAALTRDDVVATYRRTWRPDGTTLVLVGDLTQAAATDLAERLFGSWRADAAAPDAPAQAIAALAPRVIVVEMPDAGQAGVVVARAGIRRDDPDYYAGSVANAVLGVGFSSRLNQEIRIKRGLAYGARSSLDARRLTGPFTASTQTKNPSAPEVVGIIAAELKRLGEQAAPPAELDTRKAVLVGNFGRTIETNGGIAGTLADYVVEGVPLAELARYTPAIDGVDPRAVQKAAARLLDPAQASIVVVGDARQFLPALRAAYPAVTVIPVAQLDLDAADLTR